MVKAIPEGIGPLLSMKYIAGLLGESPEVLRRLATEAASHYRPFDQPKRNDPTRTRRIDNPQDPLKAIQRRLKARVLDRVQLPAFIIGGVPGRSARQNSAVHVGKRTVATLDIKDFFPDVKAKRIYKMWRLLFKASKSVARLLTDLTTFEGHLPQGCPASNAIANLVVLPLATELEALCRSRGLAFTMYVDDIAISGRGAEAALPVVIGKIHEHGFAVSSRKVRVMPRGRHQEVTGNVVNAKLSNGRAKLRYLGGRLLRALKNGISDPELQRLEGAIHHASGIDIGQGRRLHRLLQYVHAMEPLVAAQTGGEAS